MTLSGINSLNIFGMVRSKVLRSFRKSNAASYLIPSGKDFDTLNCDGLNLIKLKKLLANFPKETLHCC